MNNQEKYCIVMYSILYLYNDKNNNEWKQE